MYILIYKVYQEYLSRICDNRLPYTFKMLKNEEMGAGAQPERDSGGKSGLYHKFLNTFFNVCVKPDASFYFFRKYFNNCNFFLAKLYIL